jgi:hypothetical protein
MQNDFAQDQIVINTLRYLKSHSAISRRRITELHLSRCFTTVEFDDESVGASMSYYRLADTVLAGAEQRIIASIAECPFSILDEGVISELLGGLLEHEAGVLLVRSLMTSIASALSAPVIAQGGDLVFRTAKSRPPDWLVGIETALVVGFGGYFYTLAAQEQIKKLHVLDLFYENRREKIDAKMALFRSAHPRKTITASAEPDQTNRIADFDLVSITGSTLCNGTLERILTEARPDSILILQGQSASLHPKLLFEAGINWVVTTVKPISVSRTARGDYGGGKVQHLLEESRLPWIYLLPVDSSPT